MQKWYPLQLQAVPKSPIWSGTRLSRQWNKGSSAVRIGESWELTVRERESCKVLNGTYAGQTLQALIDSYPDAIMGETSMQDGIFPLLVKLIDAGDRLSVQVHPDDDYAARVEADRGKAELWYILEADADAEIICGLCDGVTAEDYAAAVARGDYEGLLKHQSVRAGEVYFIPSGMPHAIGRGILLAEIQQNSDLTYRIYDYDRRQADGTRRPLQVEKALEVIKPMTSCEIAALRYSNRKEPPPSLLADSPYFRVEKVEREGMTVLAPSRYMRHLLCLGEGGELRCGGLCFPIQRGDSYLLPACLPALTLQGVDALLSTAY